MSAINRNAEEMHVFHLGALVATRRGIGWQVTFRVLSALLVLLKSALESARYENDTVLLGLFFAAALLLFLSETVLEHLVRERRSLARRARRLSERAFAYGLEVDRSFVTDVSERLRARMVRLAAKSASPKSLALYYTAATGTAAGPERRRRMCLESAIYTRMELDLLRKLQFAAVVLFAGAAVATLGGAWALPFSTGERLFALTAFSELLIFTLFALALRGWRASRGAGEQVGRILERLERMGVLRDDAPAAAVDLVDELAWEYEIARIEGPEVPAWVYRARKRAAARQWDTVSNAFEGAEVASQ